MKRPDDGFVLGQFFQRQKTKIDPMKMNDVGLLEYAQPGNILTRIGKVDLKEVSLRRMTMEEDH